MAVNKLEEASVAELKECLTKKRVRPLSKEKKKYILDLITQRNIENEKTAEQWVKSPMWKLAILQLIREGKAERVILRDGLVYYDANPYDIILTMHKIVEYVGNASDEVKDEFNRYNTYE